MSKPFMRKPPPGPSEEDISAFDAIVACELSKPEPDATVALRGCVNYYREWYGIEDDQPKEFEKPPSELEYHQLLVESFHELHETIDTFIDNILYLYPSLHLVRRIAKVLHSQVGYIMHLVFRQTWRGCNTESLEEERQIENLYRRSRHYPDHYRKQDGL